MFDKYVGGILTASSREWFGHPRGLFILFMTEMWERFSYYGMRALLMLYMTSTLLVNDEKGKEILGYSTLKSFVQVLANLSGISGEITTQIFSSQLYGLYTGFVYLTPFFGGILADRVFGQRKSVYIGGVLMAIGHFLMASEQLFFLALLFLILGNGCFKPNITTQVGSLYAEGDPRRDRAFSIFYMGINLGAFFSPLICGTLGQKLGWHYGFSAAGIGMLLGLIIYYMGRNELPQDEFHRIHETEQHDLPLTKKEWKQISALIFLCAINIVFWAVYEQQGNSMQLWADSFTDWNFFGWMMPSSWYQAFNPLFIFAFTPVLNLIWNWQNQKSNEPNSTTKMGIGCFLLGLAFVVMLMKLPSEGSNEKVSIFWLALATWVLTMGEIYLSPIGLSLVTKVAPARVVSMMMGVWFLSSFLGNYLSGVIGSYYEIMSKPAFFTLLIALGFIAGVIFIVSRRPLDRMMKAD